MEEKKGKKVNYNYVYIQSVTKYTCREYIIFILYYINVKMCMHVCM